MAVAGAGREGDDLVIHRWDHAGVVKRLGQTVVNIRLLGTVALLADAVGVPLGADLIGGESVILPGAAVIGDVDGGVALIIALLLIVF
ncbi:hypothetical protein SDC9_206210 [bioreactor metagenome]|uniref:Uncharacterized protein n=1 Tax=bioreactor metagenome TaxID=1076179 RepID=A0A645J474_9ZZZZ